MSETRNLKQEKDLIHALREAILRLNKCKGYIINLVERIKEYQSSENSDFEKVLLIAIFNSIENSLSETSYYLATSIPDDID